MAYIDAAYYADTYKGKTIPPADFDRLSERASEQAAALSPHITLNGVDDLTASELSALKTATCVLAEHLSAVDSGEYASEKIGSYSYSAAQSMESAKTEAIKRARYFLDSVGLTYTGDRDRDIE